MRIALLAWLLLTVLLVVAPVVLRPFIEAIGLGRLLGPRAHFVSDWVFGHPWKALALHALGFGLFLPIYRKWMLFKGSVVSWFSPSGLVAEKHDFPRRAVDLFTEIGRRPRGML